MDPNNPIQGNVSNPSTSTEPVATTPPQVVDTSQVNTPVVQPTQMANETTTESQPAIDDDGDKHSRKKNILIVLVVFMLFMLALSVNVFALIQWEKSKSVGSQTEVSMQATVTPTTVSDTTNNQAVDPNTTTTSLTECADFPEMLETCTEYTCDFTHPLTGDVMNRTILGLVDGVCSYEEEMPNDGVMACNFDEELRTATAAYHRSISESESYGGSASVQLNPDGSEVETTSTIDGEIVDNPLEEALASGQCVISGY